MRVLRRIKLWLLGVNKLNLSPSLLPSSSFLSRLLSHFLFICSSRRFSDRGNIGVPVVRHLLRERSEVQLNCLSDRNEAVMVTLKCAVKYRDQRYHNPAVFGVFRVADFSESL